MRRLKFLIPFTALLPLGAMVGILDAAKLRPELAVQYRR